MDHRLRIVVVDGPKSGPKVIFIGTDSTDADQAFDKAAKDSRNEAVRLFVYPPHSRIRRPLEEAALVKDQSARALEDAKARADADLADAKANRDAAEAALAAATAAHDALLTKTETKP